MQRPLLDGDLETLGVQATLKLLALSGKTGMFIVTSGQETFSLYLSRGQIAAFQDDFVQRPDLLEALRLLGKIDKKVAAELRLVISPHSAITLEMLVNNSVINKAEMLQWQEYGVIQAMSRAVRWQRGRFEFHRTMLQGNQLALNVDHVLQGSLRQADEWDKSAAADMSHTAVARWVEDFLSDVKHLGLEPDEINVLCLANGQFSLQEIAYALRASEALIAQHLGHLLKLQMIKLINQTPNG